jgi:hypothetical protein
MVYSGAWGKLIHEKNQRHKKSRDTVPLSHENCQSWELSPPARNRVGKSVNWWHIQGTMLIIFFCSVPTPLPPPMSLWIGIRTGNMELDNRSSADSAHPQFSIRFQHLFFIKNGGGHFIPIDNWATTEYWNEFHKKRFYFNHIATFGGNRTNINKTQQAWRIQLPWYSISEHF